MLLWVRLSDLLGGAATTVGNLVRAIKAPHQADYDFEVYFVHGLSLNA